MFDLMYSSSFSENFYEVLKELGSTDCDRPDVDYLLKSGVCNSEGQARLVSCNVGSFIMGKHNLNQHDFVGFINDFLEDEESCENDVRAITKKCLGKEIEPPHAIIAIMCFPRFLDNIRELYESGELDKIYEESTATVEDTDFF